MIAAAVGGRGYEVSVGVDLRMLLLLLLSTPGGDGVVVVVVVAVPVGRCAGSAASMSGSESWLSGTKTPGELFMCGIASRKTRTVLAGAAGCLLWDRPDSLRSMSSDLDIDFDTDLEDLDR